MMQNPGADDLIEMRLEFRRTLDRQLVHLEILETVLSLEFQGTAHAGCAEIYTRYPRVRPTQGVLGRLRCSAAGDENREIFRIAPGGPKKMIVGAASLHGPATAVDTGLGSRREGDRDAARKTRAPPRQRGRHRRLLIRGLS